MKLLLGIVSNNSAGEFGSSVPFRRGKCKTGKLDKFRLVHQVIILLQKLKKN